MFYKVIIFKLLVIFPFVSMHAVSGGVMTEYINKHCALIITIPSKLEGGKADLAVVNGVMIERNGRYLLNTDVGEIRLNSEWIQRIQPMKPEYVGMFGDVNFFFPVPESEFNKAGYSYKTNSKFDRTIEVID